MKKNFAEPEMEVVRFNAQEIVTAMSGRCPFHCDEFAQGDDNW